MNMILIGLFSHIILAMLMFIPNRRAVLKIRKKLWYLLAGLLIIPLVFYGIGIAARIASTQMISVGEAWVYTLIITLVVGQAGLCILFTTKD